MLHISVKQGPQGMICQHVVIVVVAFQLGIFVHPPSFLPYQRDGSVKRGAALLETGALSW